MAWLNTLFLPNIEIKNSLTSSKKLIAYRVLLSPLISRSDLIVTFSVDSNCVFSIGVTSIPYDQCPLSKVIKQCSLSSSDTYGIDTQLDSSQVSE